MFHSILLSKKCFPDSPPASYPPVMNLHLSRAKSKDPSKNTRENIQAWWPWASPSSQVQCLTLQDRTANAWAKHSRSHFGKHIGGFLGRSRDHRMQEGKSGLTLLILHSPHHEVHAGSICLAAQFEGLISLWTLSVSCRIFWSSPWLMLNCSNTKSWISFTKEVGRSVGKKVWGGG